MGQTLRENEKAALSDPLLESASLCKSRGILGFTLFRQKKRHFFTEEALDLPYRVL
jgi:hypothetical protein